MATNENAPSLLPCPFCGGTPVQWGHNLGVQFIECRDCKISVHRKVGETSDEYLLSRWNRRTPAPQPESGSDAAQEALRLVGNIKWLSADKDNMEFTARASCFQVDALKTLASAYREKCEEVARLKGREVVAGDEKPNTNGAD